MALFDGLSKYQPHALTALRIMTGVQFLEHGTQKFFGFPAGGPPALAGLILVQAFLELIGGVLIALGLFTRPVAFILSGNMAVAYFMAHMPKSFFPAVNGGDAAILFCFVFLYLFFAGPGLLALDNRKK